MFPVLLKTSWLTIYSFGTMLAVAFIAGLYLMRSEMRRRKLDPEYAYDLVLGAAFGGLIGARLFYVVGHWDFYAKNPAEIFLFWNGGLVFYGGLLGGALGLAAIARWRKLDIFKIGDSVAAPLALGTAIGRIGCFLNGCCYGIAAKAPWGFKFQAIEGTYLPTQLIEMVWALIMFGVIYFWLEKKFKFKSKGTLFLIYLALYGTGRFLVEFIRFATWRLAGIFTFSQLVSAIIMAVSLFFLIRRWRANAL